MFELNENKAKAILNGSSYKVVDIAHANVVDSFVASTNKVGTASGEARLYVSSQGNDLYNAFFKFDSGHTITKGKKDYDGCPSNCFFSKNNLQKYMEDAWSNYTFPKQFYRGNISEFYFKRINKVKALTDEKNFKIYNQKGLKDSDRFYIGSADSAWELMREISLPTITKLNIYKLVNDSDPTDIQYYFELYLDTDEEAKIHLNRKDSEDEVEDKIINDITINETEKNTIIKARKGQGKFRSNTLSIMPKCPFTGISETALLRASHIIPWAKCKTNEQRINGFNGISLTPTYDVLFDHGLISFENNGGLLVSNNLQNEIIKCLNIKGGSILDIANDKGEKSPFLEYHRHKVFKGKT